MSKIEESQFGDTARTYDYSKQKIDESRSFAFILDEKNNSVENHKLLNDFDSRSLEELKFPVFCFGLLKILVFGQLGCFY